MSRICFPLVVEFVQTVQKGNIEQYREGTNAENEQKPSECAFYVRIHVYAPECMTIIGVKTPIQKMIVPITG